MGVITHTQISLRMNYLPPPAELLLARVIALIMHMSPVNVYQSANQNSGEYMPRLHCYKVDITLQLTPLQLEYSDTVLPLSMFHCEALK